MLAWCTVSGGRYRIQSRVHLAEYTACDRCLGADPCLKEAKQWIALLVDAQPMQTRSWVWNDREHQTLGVTGIGLAHLLELDTERHCLDSGQHERFLCSDGQY